MSASSHSRRNSIFIAAAIAVGFAVWIASGLGRDLPEPAERGARADAAPIRVEVATSRAETRRREITASARTEPDRAIELKAETEGRVVAIGAERGAVVSVGRALAELDPRDRRARLAETEALIRQRELEFEAARRLRGEEFISEAELAANEADLAAARAARERILLEIEHTRIEAPFDAVVHDRLVEIGDYVATGDPIAQLVDADPLIVVGNVNERDIGALEVGGTGVARVLGGPAIEGTVRYLAPVADESTRSFRVELAIPNPDRRLRVGVSAELLLAADEITTHTLSSGLLTLADDGTIGVKIVDNANRVRFLPVELAGSADGGFLLVTGLPAEVRLITVGQGFVSDGQLVTPVEDATALTRAQ